MKKLIVAGMVAVALGSVSIPAAARVELIVNIAPPPPVVEVVPVPRVGFVWVPGFWDWRHGGHYWVAGHYVRHRPGYVYARARWVQHGGRWAYTRPGWHVATR